MIFYKGEPLKGNLFYCTKKKNEKKFSQYGNPLQINSKFGTAVSMGTIRAGQMAIGKDGVIHVVWNGSPQAKGQLLYSRKVDDEPFTKQIDLMGKTSHLDGGASVAANDQGSVHVVWHANPKGKEGEINRKVYVASSKDNGVSLQAEKVVSPAGLGVCACCSLKAFSKGNMFGILFRELKETAEMCINLHQEITVALSNPESWVNGRQKCVLCLLRVSALEGRVF